MEIFLVVENDLKMMDEFRGAREDCDEGEGVRRGMTDYYPA